MTYRSHDGISLCGFFFAFRCVVRRTGFATAFFLTGAGRVLFALTILSYSAVFTFTYSHILCNKTHRENGFTISPDGFPLCFIEIRKNYFPCSNCNVLVAWSQTSVGPKYWIGPGYT